MFNKACAMPWCRTVVDFEVKTRRFWTIVLTRIEKLR